MTEEVLKAFGLVISNTEAADKVCEIVLAAKGLVAVPKGTSGPGGSLGPFKDNATPAPPPKPAWKPSFVPAWMNTWVYVYGEPPRLQTNNPNYATLETANAIAAIIPGATVETVYQQLPLIIQPEYQLAGNSADGKPNGKRVNAGDIASNFASAKDEGAWLGNISETKAKLGLA